MKKSKVLVTASTFPRWKGDTEPGFIYDICKEYTKYYNVTVLTPYALGAKHREIMDGIHVIRYSYFPIKKLQTLCAPGSIIHRIKEKKIRILLVPFLLVSMYMNILKRINKYDLVHANWIIPQGIIQMLFSKPYIITGHGGDVTFGNGYLMKKIKNRCLNKSECIIPVSNDLKGFILKNFDVDEKKIKVISMGCDTLEFSPDNRIDNYFNTKKKTILFVGRLVEKKGVRYLIKAVDGMDIKLIIVGDGPEKDELINLSKSVNCDIDFVGSKSRSEIKLMYPSCDIVCIPSVCAANGDKDGLPVVAMEAMASGALVIGTNVGGMSEILKDDYNGIVVKEKDSEAIKKAITMVLSDKDKQKCIKQNAISTARKYDVGAIALNYKNVIDCVLRRIEKND